MPTIVVAPDDTEIEFPDDVPDSEILRVMRREYGSKKSVAQALPADQKQFFQIDIPAGETFQPKPSGPLPGVSILGVPLGADPKLAYPVGLEGRLPMGSAIDGPPVPDTPFGAALGSTLSGESIKTVAGVSNAIGRNLFKTNEEEKTKLEAQLAELEQNSQGNDFFAKRSRQQADVIRGRLGSLNLRPESPLTGPIRESTGGFAKNLQGFNEDVIQPYYGANPESKNVGAQLGRGIGGFVNAAPLMAGGPVGLVAGAGQMAAVAYQDRYEQALKETGDEGLAAQEARKAAEKTGPALLAYMVGGKLAAGAAAKIAGEAAAPLTKAAVGTVAATASNVATGSTIRALEGQDWKPTLENLTMDALFGLVHGAGEYSKASQEARQRASEELKARGVPEEAATPVAPAEEAATVPSDAPQPDLSKFGNKVDVETGVVVTPEGKIDVATGAPLDPVREQSLKSLGKDYDSIVAKQAEQRDWLNKNYPERSTLDVTLEPVSRETFQREMGQDVLEDHIAFRDPTSKQVVQVPREATPEQIAETVKVARAEEAAAQQRAQQDDAAAVEERQFIEKARALNAEDALRRMEEFKAQGAGVDPSKITPRTPVAKPEPAPVAVDRPGETVWNNPLRLKNLRNDFVLKRRKDPTFGGTPEKFNASIKEMDERMKYLMSEESTPERPSPEITPARDPSAPTAEAPGASNISELQQKRVVAGADIQKGLRESTGEVPSKELWEKNFLREYPEMEGDQVALDRIRKASTRADELQQESPTKPMQEVVRQGENPIPTEEPTSIKNAKVDQERQERGLPAMEPVVRREFGTVWDDAIRDMDADPYAQTRLVNSLRESPRPVTDTENAMLLHRQIELQNLYDRELKNLTAAYELRDMDLVQEHQTRQREISDQLTDLYQINRSVGTEQGRGLAARKMMAMEDFSLAKMEQRMRAEKGGDPLTPEESVKLVEMQKKIATTEEAFEKYRVEMEEKVAALEAQKAVVKIVERVKKESAPKPSQVEKATAWLKSKADEARQRIRDRREKGQLFSGGINPEELDDYIIIGASKVAEGVGNFAKWSKSMVDEFGEVIRPYLKTIFEKAGATAKEAPKKLTEEEQRTRILDGIKTRVAEGDTADKLGPYIQRLAENAVRAGIKERGPLVESVHKVLSEIIPGITPREVQDAISGYGKFSQLSQDEVKVQLRDLKGQLQQVSKIEDMQSKIPPKKTGVERRSPSDEERRLIKEVNELKKKGGFTVTDPATQLKTSLGAIKTRLTNQIADLDLAISKGERIPTKKGGVPYDTEANLLKARRDALKQQYDSIFQKPGLTDEQRIQQAKNATERSIKEYEDRIKNGELARRAKKPGPTTPELEALRKDRDALKAELEELRASDSYFQEAKVQEGLKKSIAGLEEKLATGETATPEKAGPESKEVSALKERRKALQEQLKAVREASPERLQERIDAADESLRKSIDEYDKKLQAGDFSKRTTKPPLETPEIEALRSERDAMRKLFEELRNAQKPKLSPEEVALKAAKSRMKTMTAQYERKLAAGDFEPRKKKEFPVDQEFLKLKAENTVAKEKYMKALFDARMAARPTWKKIAGGVAEAANTSRSVLTSFDVSAPLRQGGFIAFGNPVRAAKALGPMFRALRSEKNQTQVMEAIKSDPMYPKAEQAKLFLSDDSAISLTKMEEAYAARWAQKIPGVAASGRAYITFLNKLRFDTFKAMTDTLTKSGTPTPEESKAIANYINVATGRGSIHSSLAQAASGLNTVFFAPRYVTSRFQLLLGQPFYGGNARTRKLIATEYAKMLTGAALVYGIGRAAGADIELDSKSSDFLKLKFGNTRVDPLFGLIQATTLMSRLGQGKTTTSRGEEVDLTADKKGPLGASRGSVAARFLRTKLAPVPSSLVSLAYEEDLKGDPFGPKEAAINSVVPISFGDIKKVMEEQGVPAGTAFSILSMFGMGVQTYPPPDPPKSRSSSSDREGREKRER